MSRYRILLKVSDDAPVRSIFLSADEPGEAMIAAQRYKKSVELWLGEERLCSIDRCADQHDFWVITSGERGAHARAAAARNLASDRVPSGQQLKEGCQ